MKANNKSWDQCGNAQAAVDSKDQIIVACDVTDESNDKKQFEPMLEQAQKNVGQDKKIKSALADSGNYSESNVKFAEDKKIGKFTEGIGVDAVIIAAHTSSLDHINFAGQIIRKEGRVVVV